MLGGRGQAREPRTQFWWCRWAERAAGANNKEINQLRGGARGSREGGAGGNDSGAEKINNRCGRAGRAGKPTAPKKTNEQCGAGGTRGKPKAQDN